VSASDEDKQEPTGQGGIPRGPLPDVQPGVGDQKTDSAPSHDFEPEGSHDHPRRQRISSATGTRAAVNTKNHDKHDKHDKHGWYSQDDARRKLTKSVVKEISIFAVIVLALVVAGFIVSLKEQQNTQKAIAALIKEGREGRHGFLENSAEARRNFISGQSSEAEANRAAASAARAEAHARKAAERQAQQEASRARAEANLSNARARAEGNVSEAQARRAASLSPTEKLAQEAQTRNTEAQARREATAAQLTAQLSSFAVLLRQRLAEPPSRGRGESLKALEKRVAEIIAKLNRTK